MHGFAFEAEEDGEVVAAFFDADAFRDDGDEGVGAGAAGTATSADAELEVFDAGVFFGAPGEVGHAGSVKRDHGFFGVVVEVLADDEEGFAVAVAVGVREGDVGCEGDVAGHFLPEIAELVARVPDVIAGGVDGVLFRAGIVTGAAGDDWATDVGLALEEADGGVESFGGAVEVGWRRDLRVGCGAGLSPVGYGGLRCGCLCDEELWCEECDDDDKDICGGLPS